MKNKTEEHKLTDREQQENNKTIEQLHSLIDKHLHLTSQAIYENSALLILEDSIKNLKSEIVDLLTKK